MDESSANPPDEPDAPSQAAIRMPEAIFAGVWANVASLQRTPHEFTLDFVRMGPRLEYGEYVARISFSEPLFVELVDMFNDAYARYIAEQGIPS